MIRYFLLCESEPAHAGAPLRLRKPANRDQKAQQRHTNPTQPTTQKTPKSVHTFLRTTIVFTKPFELSARQTNERTTERARARYFLARPGS